MAAIGSGERHFYVQQLAGKTGIPSQTIWSIVRGLEGELAIALPPTGPRTAHYFERLDHPIWRMAIDLLEAMRQDPATSYPPTLT